MTDQTPEPLQRCSHCGWDRPKSMFGLTSKGHPCKTCSKCIYSRNKVKGNGNNLRAVNMPREYRKLMNILSREIGFLLSKSYQQKLTKDESMALINYLKFASEALKKGSATHIDMDSLDTETLRKLTET